MTKHISPMSPSERKRYRFPSNKPESEPEKTPAPPITAEVEHLLTMLSFKRPAWSTTEEAFITRFIIPFQDHENVTKFWKDSHGNLFFEVAGGSKQLFTCHTDTVHHKTHVGVGKDSVPFDDGSLKMQNVLYDPLLQMAYKDDGECLGADDGAGVWICLEIIRAGVPSTVAFFRAEEIGGVGSSESAKSAKEFYEGFDSALAFDRRGTSDVITYQSRGRCSSDAWASALANQLNDLNDSFNYKKCDGGVFTDTANLMAIIPECSNISVGYHSEHGQNESLDVQHLLALRDAIIKVDWCALPIEREPGVYEPKYYGGYYGGWDWDNGEWGREAYYDKFSGKEKTRVAPLRSPPGFERDDDEGAEDCGLSRVDKMVPLSLYDLASMSYHEMVEFAQDDPELFAASVYDLIWGQ